MFYKIHFEMYGSFCGIKILEITRAIFWYCGVSKYKTMIKKYKNRAIAAFGIVLFAPPVLGALIINTQKAFFSSFDYTSYIILFLFILRIPVFSYGIYNLAKGKGYKWHYSFLGLLSGLGLLIALMLKDKTKVQNKEYNNSA